MTAAASTVRVVAAVIVSDRRLLACRRNAGRSDGGLWEFPGGKIEAGEGPAEALTREIREELGVHIDVGARIHRATTRVQERLIDLDTYWARLAGERPMISTDHDVLRWLRRSELSSLEWCAPDLPVVELLACGSGMNSIS